MTWIRRWDVVATIVLILSLLFVAFMFKQAFGADLGIVNRSEFINVRVPWGDSIQVFTCGGNSNDAFIYFATTGLGAVASAWIDTIDAGTAGQDFIKFRDQVSDIVPADSSAGQYSLTVMSWNGGTPTITDFEFTMVDSGFGHSLERALMGADSLMKALEHNQTYSLLRIFNTLDSAEAANLIYGRFTTDMSAVHRIAARNGVPCSLSVQVLWPPDGSGPKDSVQYFCVTPTSNTTADTTLALSLRFHNSNQVNIVDTVGTENHRPEQ
jgi:hypothetical protein